MSSTMCLLPLIAALYTAETNLSDKLGQWQGSTPSQDTFLKNYYYPHTKDVSGGFFSDQELKNSISIDVAVVNNFLSSNGYSIQLQNTGPNSLYMASILDVILKWLNPGEKATLHGKNDQKQYAAVKMSDAQFTCVNVTSHTRSVFVLNTENKDDRIYITHAFNKDTPINMQKPYSGFDLISYLSKISKEINEQSLGSISLDNLYFPMINYDYSEQLEWIIGIFHGAFRISQALQQTKFQMDETGAHVKSAIALGTLGLSNDYQVNEPFYLWIERKGVSLPILTAYFDESSWQDPQNRTLDDSDSENEPDRFDDDNQ